MKRFRFWLCPASAAAVLLSSTGFSQEYRHDVPDSGSTSARGAHEVFLHGQWQCRPGYLAEKGFCVPLTAPAHATLVGPGDRWECDWGYRKTGSQCHEVRPPPHGYVDASGNDWVCYPKFERVSDRCVSSSEIKPTPEVTPASEVASTPAAEAAPDPERTTN